MRIWILLWLTVGASACHSAAVITALPEPVPHHGDNLALEGVDSTVAAQAAHLASGAFASPEQETESAQLKEEGLLLASLGTAAATDGMPFLPRPATHGTPGVDAREEAVRAFNEGAQLLEAYASEPDSVRAKVFLGQAQARFEASLKANSFDEETRYWLARVYRVRASALGEEGAVEDAIKVLRQLFAMDQSRHDYAAILAEAVERRESREAQAEAGSLWLLAAQIAADDTLVATAAADSGAIFNYYVRSSRASVAAGQGASALAALKLAEEWARAAHDRELVRGDREWILWDGGNLATRSKWDSLQTLGELDAEAAAAGIRALVSEITQAKARAEVRHHLALLYHALGRDDEAVAVLRRLWLESGESDSTPAAHRVGEDYGTLLFNLGMERKRSGDRVAALAYLLQSEETGYSGTARSALEVALLLSNNAEAAYQAAGRAMNVMEQLTEKERQQLLRFMIELERRRGDREAALHYLQQLRNAQ